MAIQQYVFTTNGIAASAPNSQSTLATAVSDAIAAADTANVSNDASTEIAAIDTALTALTADQLAGAVVINVDLSLVTTKAQVAKILQAAVRHLTVSTDTFT